MMMMMMMMMIMMMIQITMMMILLTMIAVMMMKAFTMITNPHLRLLHRIRETVKILIIQRETHKEYEEETCLFCTLFILDIHPNGV